MSVTAKPETRDPVSILDAADVTRRTVEIAAAELRYGRPIIVGTRPAFVVMALDTVTEEDFSRFAAASEDNHQLFLTPARAASLGLAATGGALVPLRHRSYREACTLGYTKESGPPEAWSPAPSNLLAITELTRLALLLPALVVTQIEPDDPRFAGLSRVSLAEIEGARDAETRFDIVARTEVPLRDVAKAEFIVFRGGLAQRDQIAIVVGDPDLSKPVPVRIHSSCLTGDLFGSLKCDCGDQLREGLRLIEARGGGVLVYLDQEGRGTGIGAKMMAYGYQAHGLDTIDADAALGFGPDLRRYDAAVTMLTALGITSVELLTNNPSKAAFLEKAGIAVRTRTAVLGEVTNENRAYLTTKARRAGHTLDVAAIASAITAER